MKEIDELLKILDDVVLEMTQTTASIHPTCYMLLVKDLTLFTIDDFVQLRRLCSLFKKEGFEVIVSMEKIERKKD